MAVETRTHMIVSAAGGTVAMAMVETEATMAEVGLAVDMEAAVREAGLEARAARDATERAGGHGRGEAGGNKCSKDLSVRSAAW